MVLMVDLSPHCQQEAIINRDLRKHSQIDRKYGSSYITASHQPKAAQSTSWFEWTRCRSGKTSFRLLMPETLITLIMFLEVNTEEQLPEIYQKLV